MISGVASLVFIPLLAISIVHLMWAFGSHWPAADEKSLARTVTGFKNVDAMPPRALSAAAAVAIFCAGLIALMMTNPAEDLLLTGIGGLLTLIFLGRGIAGYTAFWRALTPEEPFATFDRKLYAPLCLGISAGFLFLTVWRLM